MLNEMKMKSMSDRSIMTFKEIEPEERLVWHHSSADAEWKPTANPMMPDWPKVLLTTVTFTDDGEKTQVRLVWTPHEATETEIACFAGAMDALEAAGVLASPSWTRFSKNCGSRYARAISGWPLT